MRKSKMRSLVLAPLSALALIVAIGACTPPKPATGGNGGPVYGINPDVPHSGTQSGTVTYGPYTIPAAKSAAHEDAGMIQNKIRTNVQKPCTNCYITEIRADLKNPDGSTANVDQGLWLHHMVLSAAGKTDPTCGSSFLSFLGERFFASGNERTRIRMPAGYGYKVGTESWTMIYDLMNHNLVPKDVSLVLSYSWAPATANIKPVRPVWLDIDQCGDSEQPVKSTTAPYQYDYTWNVNVPGKMVGAGGHIHDGGINVEIVNAKTNVYICNSVAAYGGPGYVDPMGDHNMNEMTTIAGATTASTDSHGHSDGDHMSMHVSSMTQCLADATGPVTTLVTGDQVRISAKYDPIKRPSHVDKHGIMGIAVIYIAAS